MSPRTVEVSSGASGSGTTNTCLVRVRVITVSFCLLPSTWPVVTTSGRMLITVSGLVRSEEHTSELQSLRHLVCRLLLEKNKQSPDSLHHAIAGSLTMHCLS